MRMTAEDEREIFGARSEPCAGRGRLTREARARGGRQRWAGTTALERGQEMYRVARARWLTASADQRAAVGAALVEARQARQRVMVPMLPPAPTMDPGPPQPCECCGRAAAPFRPHVLRSHVVTWRCRVHAVARRANYGN